MPTRFVPTILILTLGAATAASAQEFFLHRFQRTQLTDAYYSEGVNFGDLNRDGVADVVHGPHWYAGPDYKNAREIYPAKAQNRQAYADSFFSWVHDFNGDGWNDVLAVGFPGTPAYVYENPTAAGFDKPWPKHEVFDWVSNESPQFTNIVGDERPELVCTRDGRFGYATIDPKQPLGRWTFHAVSGDVATKRFGHGLGVGDIDGDKRPDILTKDGWFQQPKALDDDPVWEFHPFLFAQAGGADMYAYDVDGDGDNDVITSLDAHAFGLAWFEQIRDGEQITFKPHTILGQKADDNPYGVLFTELHTVSLVDMDGDGLKDLVTGKTYWSHHTQSPLWDAGAVVYWFQLARTDDGVDWIPHLADDEAGVGRQVIAGDLNGDGLVDLLSGGMKGCHIMIHEREQTSEEEFRAAQPRKLKKLASGLSPSEAVAQISVPNGFHVQLAAGEPDVHQPIAMAIDARGRIWVAEAYTYPKRAPDGEGQDQIIILEDTDGNGSLDRRTVFAKGLNLVSGLEVGFGGVWVGAAPYLLFIPDRDGDDRPDGEPEILLDGWGYQDTHETLNGFIWGPDGWLYGCHGVFTHSRVGQPGTPDQKRTPINAGIWRYHPTRREFEVFAWGTSNPWGVDFDDRGQAFCTACVIPHLFHVIQGARYQRQAGSHFDAHVYDDIPTIADHVHYAGNIRDHAWWGHEPDLKQDTSAAGGGHAHCGAMIYLGDNWPAPHRNQIFFHNIHGNRVNNDLLERSGSGYVGHHGPDLLLANDRWFRGINLRYGPDGTVYLIDWYDRNACHRATPEIWDRTNGRVYRVSHGKPEPLQVDLESLDDQQLAELQLHANDWFVRTSRRILQARAAAGSKTTTGSGARPSGLAPAAAARLRGILTTHDDATRRLRALWALHAARELSTADYLAQLESRDEHLRAWSIQLLVEVAREQAESLPNDVLARLVRTAASDSSAVVRLYLASALLRLPLAQRWDLASVLVAHGEDVDDHNLPRMYWYAIEPLVTNDPPRAWRLAKAARIPLITRHVARRAASDNQALDVVARAIADSRDQDEQKLLVDEMLVAFEGRVDIPMPPAWSEAYERLLESEDPRVREQADLAAVALGDQRIFPRLRKLVVDAETDLAKRKWGLAVLMRGRDAEAPPTLRQLLDQPDLRAAAIRGLAAYDDPRTPASLLSVYPKLTDDEKRDAINTLVTRSSHALALLTAIEKKEIPRTDLHAFHVRQLMRLDDEKLLDRVRAVWGEIRESSGDKQALIASRKEQLNAKVLAAGDASNGRRLFNKACANCHTLFGDGGKVGPDITGSNRANLDYLLENVLDPSAVLGKDYRMTILTTTDGRIVSGLVQKETDSALTVRTLNDTIIVPKKEIDDRQLSNLSLMPDGLLDQLTPDEVRDLVTYLGSPVQVAPRGPRAPIDAKTGCVPDALEGESLAVLSKSDGDAASQKMDPFTKDRWSGADHLWWTGAKPGSRLELELPVARAGRFEVEVVLTKARDYGIVQLALDGEKLGESIDLFNEPDVITTGVLSVGERELAAGKHRLTIEIVGAHPKAVRSYMFGLDYVRLVPK